VNAGRHELRQKPMVGWYDPAQLLRTGGKVLISTLLATRGDYRHLESFAGEQAPFEYQNLPEIWIDYVADVGDGWNSTYTIASLLARPHLEVRTSASRLTTARGRILVMGGDQVYPTPSRSAYQERLVAPYETAFPAGACTSEEHRPSVFAVPGNHDWYDGLISFSRQFCTPRSIGGWRTEQRRSYFAIRLPHRWWLLALDIQLEADIDQPQIDYFRRILREDMRKGDRLILALAEPHWVHGNIYSEPLQKNLVTIIRELDAAEMQLQLIVAGDNHHYRRHASDTVYPRQLITSGGGGAFLHPTCGEPVDTIQLGDDTRAREYRLVAEYPAAAVSRRLACRNLAFLLLNPWFGTVTAISYLLVTWVAWASLSRTSAESITFLPPRYQFWESVVLAPQAVLMLLAIVAGFVLFTDTHKRWYRWTAGVVHGIVHIAAAFGLAYLVARFDAAFLQPSLDLAPRLTFVALAILLGGFVVGPTIMGVYLLVSLLVFRRHSNESFSSLRIQDYKHFLRMHIDTSGLLHIYPIAVDRVPREWKAGPPGTHPLLVPKNADLEPYLLDGPIVLGERR